MAFKGFHINNENGVECYENNFDHCAIITTHVPCTTTFSLGVCEGSC